MKFIISGEQLDYFRTFSPQQEEMPDFADISAVIPRSLSVDEVRAELIQLTASRAYNSHERRVFDRVVQENVDPTGWTIENRETGFREQLPSLHLRLAFKITRWIIEVDSLERLDVFSKLLALPLLINWYEVRGRCPYPSLYVYDDSVE